MKKAILISILVIGLGSIVFAQVELKTQPVPSQIQQEVVPVPIPLPQIEPQPVKGEKIEIELKKSEEIKEPVEICKNLCGDGICQEIVCMATGCPCPETPVSCPQDCLKKKEVVIPLPILPVIQFPSPVKIKIDPKAKDPILIEEKSLEVKGLEPKELPKISVEIQTPTEKSTTVQIELDKEEKIIKIEHQNVVAQTQEKIKVEEKSLKIETEKGEISVNVLPALATQIAIQKEPQQIKEVFLKVEKENPVYEIKGEKPEKFLGIFPVKIQLKVKVEAISGKIAKIEKSFLMKILDLFSF